MNSACSADSNDDSRRRRSDLVAAVAGIEKHVEFPVRLGRPLPGCITNMVHEIWVGRRRMILKSGRDGDIRREYVVLNELSRRGFPAPQAELVSTPVDSPGVVLVMDAWEGSAATAESPALVEAGAAMSRPRHIWCQNDSRFVGLIDWGDAMIGDPMFDVARASLAGPRALDLLMQGYGEDRPPNPRLFSLATAYCGPLWR